MSPSWRLYERFNLDENFLYSDFLRVRFSWFCGLLLILKLCRAFLYSIYFFLHASLNHGLSILSDFLRLNVVLCVPSLTLQWGSTISFNKEQNELTQLFTLLRVSQGMSKHSQSCAVWSAIQLLMTCVFWSSQVTEVLWVRMQVFCSTCALSFLSLQIHEATIVRQMGAWSENVLNTPDVNCCIIIRKILRFGQYVVYHAYTGSTEKSHISARIIYMPAINYS